MLYECWQGIAREQRNELAVHDLGSGRQWTFHQLEQESEHGDSGKESLICPQGITAEFVLMVLRAWRARKVVLPLETDQPSFVLPELPSEIVHLKTTSATTGVPRMVAFTAAQLMADALNIVQTMGLRRDWPNLGVISLAHSYGFSNLVLPLLLHGIPLVLLDSPLPEAVRQSSALLSGVSGLTLAAVPALWRAWHEAGAFPPQVRLAISAGAPLPLSLEREIFEKTGLKIHNFYGATECGGIAYDGTETPRIDATCVGTPMCNVNLSIATDGCLEVRSGAVAEGYWPEPHAVLGLGCYHTSDLAEITGGQVFLRGRVGDQINVAGRKVSPEEIERVLLKHPLVRDCLVFGVPSADEDRSEIIVVSVAAEATVSGETLKQFLLSRLPAWQVPREWCFVDSLPANQRGKLSRAEWRNRYLRERRAV